MTTRIKPTAGQVAAVLRHYGIAEHRAAAAVFGAENATYIIKTGRKTFVLRIYPPGKKTAQAIQTEIDFTEFVRERLKITPRIMPNESGSHITQAPMGQGSWSCILMEFVRGEHPTSYTPELIQQMAVIQAKLHILGIEFAKTHAVPTAPLNKHSAPQLASHYGRKKGFRRAWLSRLPLGYNHFDYYGSNILLRDNQVKAVIDFDDAHLGPAVGCLATTMGLIAKSEGTTRRLRSYLGAYATIRPLSRLETVTLKAILVTKFGLIGTFWL